MGGPSAERSETAQARPRPRTQPRSVEEGNHGDRPRTGIRSAKVSNDVDIAGLSEMRWQGEGHFQSLRGQGSVAVILNKKLCGSMISYIPVSERIMVVRLTMQPVNVTVIQVYAPTTTHSEEEL